LLPVEELAVIYIDAGGWEVLARRIQARAAISVEELAKRHERYLDEITFKDEAEYVIENPDGGLVEAKRSFVDTIATLRHMAASA
jgi:guanylate kinase